MDKLEIQPKISTKLSGMLTGLTKGVIDYLDGLEITDDASCRQASAFLQTRILPLRKMISDTFDGPINRAKEIRRLELVQQRDLIEKKAVWLSPVAEADRLIRDKIERFQLDKELAVQAPAVIGLDTLIKQLDSALEQHGPEHSRVTDIMSLINDCGDGGIVTGLIPVGDAKGQRPDLVPGVSSTTGWEIKIVDPDKINRKFLVFDKVAANKYRTQVMKNGSITVEERVKEIEHGIGGIELIKTRPLRVREVAVS